MSTAANAIVRVTRRYRFAPERVFDAFLDTSLIGAWMFGPRVRSEEIVRLELEARVGGVFSFVVRRDGAEINHVGRYLEIDRPRRLAFTWGIEGESAEESRVMVEIAPVENGCELTLTHEMHPKWAEFTARAEEAWAKMLEALASALEEEGR
jgi:uncharacterized protein YndB with AHSA1/START domain